tara:strand:- start:681 stop:974 length:294 start_codon:yes stop_codon:yes gene_type:complete
MNNLIVLNKENEYFVDRCFTIELLYGGIYEIYENCEGDALDTLIDYFEANRDRFKGYFFTDEELFELDNEDDYLYGGNCGTYITFQSHEVRIKEVVK